MILISYPVRQLGEALPQKHPFLFLGIFKQSDQYRNGTPAAGSPQAPNGAFFFTGMIQGNFEVGDGVLTDG
ncbi:MAG: hypothetical protein JXR49_15555 [Acidobacteria bacterium]|nr:hypothetical protein [Acidobacteriota bacterium]